MSQWALIPNNTTPPDVLTSPDGCGGWQNVWFIFASSHTSSALHQIGRIYQERVREYRWEFDIESEECPPELHGRSSDRGCEDLARACLSVQYQLEGVGVSVLRRGLSS